MDSLEYSFGTGADAPVTWMSPADLDLGSSGGVDAVRLDFDGDGLLDDAMWDAEPPVIAAVHTWRPYPVGGTAATIDAGTEAGQGGLGNQTHRGFDEENTR